MPSNQTFRLTMWRLILEATVGHIDRGSLLLGPVHRHARKLVHDSSGTKVGGHRAHEARLGVEIIERVVHLAISVRIQQHVTGQACLECPVIGKIYRGRER